MNITYIKTNSGGIAELRDLKELLYRICQFCCSVLIVYFCWYVEAFGNLSLVVNGSFLLMSACIGVIWIIDREIRLDGIPYGIWNHLAIVVYALVTGIFVAYDSDTLIHAVRQYFIYFIIVYSFCFVSAHYNSFEWILRAINVAVIICSIHLIFFGYHYTEKRIVLSDNSNPNLLGTILNLGLFALLYRTQFSFKKLIWIIPEACVLTYNIVMTGSRKSFIVATGMLMIWGYSLIESVMKNGTKRQKVLVWVFVALGVLAFLRFFNHFVTNTELFSRMQTMGNEESNDTRVGMYIAGFEIFKNKPFFGGGLDQYQFLSGFGTYSHSTYAEMISSFGFVGSLIYLAPFLYALFQATMFALRGEKGFHGKFVLGFCLVEFFLGAGQIWLYDMSHFISWALIFLILQDMSREDEKGIITDKRFQYVKY